MLLTLPEHRQAEIRNDEEDATALYSAVALKMSIAAVPVVAKHIEAPMPRKKRILPPPIARVPKMRPVAEPLVAPVTGKKRTLPPPIARVPTERKTIVMLRDGSFIDDETWRMI